MAIKKVYLLLILISASVWMACNNQHPQEGENNRELEVEGQLMENDTTQTENQTTFYMCPMDCEEGKVYEAPGNCSVCKMPLEKALK